MSRKVEVIAEICPVCGSADVRAVESRWFTVGLDRRDQLDEEWADRVEFGCRECGVWWC